jgi:CheY-like chemotaxis protein
LFERFSQADNGPSRVFGGLGVGLALVRHFVELHGGSVDAASGGLDKGATFTVRLPVMLVPRGRSGHSNGPREATRRAASADAGELAGVKVLAVDDEPDSLLLVNDVLESAGASVLCANSAQAALGVLDTERPNVIVADLMPPMDGYEFIARLRRRPASKGGGIPAAVLTAYARAEDRTRSLLAGFQMHLAKPIDPSQLIAAVASLALARPSHE